VHTNPLAVDKSKILIQLNCLTADYAFNLPDHGVISVTNESESGSPHSMARSWDLAAYQLTSVTTKKVKKKSATTYKPLKLTSALAASSPMTSSVSLVPAAKPNLGHTDRLEIVAADLTDALGRALDGTDDGQPGGNAERGRLTTEGAESHGKDERSFRSFPRWNEVC
jgi:hypothetical protein